MRLLPFNVKTFRVDYIKRTRFSGALLELGFRVMYVFNKIPFLPQHAQNSQAQSPIAVDVVHPPHPLDRLCG